MGIFHEINQRYPHDYGNPHILTYQVGFASVRGPESWPARRSADRVSGEKLPVLDVLGVEK